MPTQRREAIPPGTLDMLILKTLTRAAQLHGFEIAQAIEQTSAGVFFVEEGSLYPCLQRMLVKGWLSAKWGRTSDNRRARYYRVTTLGRKQLEAVVSVYTRVSEAIGRVLQASPAGT